MVVDHYQDGQIQWLFCNGHHCSFGLSIGIDGYIGNFVMGTTACLDGLLIYIYTLLFFILRGRGGSKLVEIGYGISGREERVEIGK